MTPEQARAELARRELAHRTTQEPRSSLLGTIGRRAITPLASTEQVLRSSPIAPALSAMLPISQMAAGQTFMSPNQLTSGQIPNLPQMGAEELSQQTSPLGIATNVAVGLGTLRGLNRLPAGMGRGYALKQAETAAGALKSTKQALGKAKGAVIEQFGDKIVPNFKPTFAQKTLKLLKNPIYEVEFTQAGAVKPTVKNLDKVLQALGDIQTGQGFKEATKKIQSSINQTYAEVSNAMRTAYPEIAPPIEAFRSFMEKYNLVKPSIKSKGTVIGGKIKELYSKGFEEKAFEAWTKLSKDIPELRQVMKNMKKYSGRRATQKAIGSITRRILPWAVGGGILAGASSMSE